MTKLDEILEVINAPADYRDYTKQQIKELMLELIGDDLRVLSFSNKDFVDGKNNEKQVLRKKVAEL